MKNTCWNSFSRWFLPFIFPLLGILILFLGCKTLETATKLGAGIASSTGLITEDQGEAITKVGGAAAGTFEEITPEQEYFIGRTVGAMILNRYKPLNNKKANNYINVLGKTLSAMSDMPETFGGYHLLILDSDEINAFAAPGGLIFITRGMLECCRNENAVAAVIAHEIGHVEHRHGLQAIKNSRMTNLFATSLTQGAKALGPEELADATSLFEDSISDVFGTMVNNGYSKAFEREADEAAVRILKRTGYNPEGLVAMLKEMNKRLKPGGKDFAKTHPSPSERNSIIRKRVGPSSTDAAPAGRISRFKTFMKML